MMNTQIEYENKTSDNVANGDVNLLNEDLVKENWDECILKFDDLEIKSELLRGIYSYGYELPSAIQQKAIKPLYSGRDLIAQAQSGTGKTATFSIGVLERIEVNTDAIQAIIMAPTRELAEQIVHVVTDIGVFLGVKVHGCIGGAANPVQNDIRQLRKNNTHAVVGTPGRVLDLIRRRALITSDIKVLVLDEADEMLSRGFEDQIRDVFKALPDDVQAAVFSATYTLNSFDVAKRFMRNPVRILVKAQELTLKGIKQFFVAMDKESYKVETLFDIYAGITKGLYMYTNHTFGIL